MSFSGDNKTGRFGWSKDQLFFCGTLSTKDGIIKKTEQKGGDVELSQALRAADSQEEVVYCRGGTQFTGRIRQIRSEDVGRGEGGGMFLFMREGAEPVKVWPQDLLPGDKVKV